MTAVALPRHDLFGRGLPSARLNVTASSPPLT